MGWASVAASGLCLTMALAACDYAPRPKQGPDEAVNGEEDSGAPANGPRGASEPTALLDGSADCEEWERRALYVDGDGDGYGREEKVGESCDEEPPEGLTFLSTLHGDCDDSDPLAHAWTNFYTDADGDGYGVPLQEHTFACAERPIEGMAPNADDCDDTDASAQLEQYVDRDGDGYGDENERQCVAADAEGYERQPLDCDDSDPSVYYASEFEQPLDGVDSDCDGSDYALTRCEPATLAAAVSVDEDCAGPDVGFVAVDHCTPCDSSTVTVAVANFGTVAARVVVRLLEPQVDAPAEEVWALELEEPLEPGAVSEPLSGGVYGWQASLEVVSADGSSDCNPADNVRELPYGRIECFP